MFINTRVDTQSGSSFTILLGPETGEPRDLHPSTDRLRNRKSEVESMVKDLLRK